MFYSTTNIYLLSHAILYQVNAIDNTESMLTKTNFLLGGSGENITEVSWTIAKLRGDDRSVFEEFEDITIGAVTYHVKLIESITNTDYPQITFNKKVAFPTHVRMTYTMQYREFHNIKNIQHNGTISVLKASDNFTEHGDYSISAITRYNGTSSF